jgi:hypothetical protein
LVLIGKLYAIEQEVRGRVSAPLEY